MTSAAAIGRGEVPAGRSRRSELDLLRALVVVGLVFFHSARVFDSGDFYVKNEPPSELVDAVIAFASVWGMPLLFVIAGVGIWYSLGTRTTGSLARERVGRLLVPLVFGVVVVVPPQIWTRLRGRPLYDESYGDFLARFLDVELTLGDFPFVVQGAPGNTCSRPPICGSWCCCSPSPCCSFRRSGRCVDRPEHACSTGLPVQPNIPGCWWQRRSHSR